MSDRIVNVVNQYFIASPDEAASLLSQVVHLALPVPPALSIPGSHSNGDAGLSDSENARATIGGALVGPGLPRDTMGGQDAKDLTGRQDAKDLLQSSSRNRSRFPVMADRIGVFSLAFSPKGNFLAIGIRPDTIQIWNLTKGELERELEGLSGSVNSVAFSPNGDRVAIGSDDNTVRIWNLKKNEFRELKGHSGSVISVAFSPNKEDNLVASGSSDNTVRIWNLTEGTFRALRDHSDIVTSVAFSPNKEGNLVASGSDDNAVRIWDLKENTSQVLKSHHGGVTSVAFSPNGKRMASANDDTTVLIWDLESRKSRPLKDHLSSVVSVAFSPNGKRVAGACGDRMVRIWDVETGRLHQELKGHRSMVFSVAFSHNGTFLASAGADNRVLIWTNEISASDLEGVINSDREKDEFLDDLEERLTSAGIDVKYMEQKLDYHKNMYHKERKFQELFAGEDKSKMTAEQKTLAMTRTVGLDVLFKHGIRKYVPVELDKYYEKFLILM